VNQKLGALTLEDRGTMFFWMKWGIPLGTAAELLRRFAGTGFEGWK